jgi:hypothetical protein
MTPTGLLRLGRRQLRLVTAVYLVIAGIALGAPALLAAQPRGDSSHHNLETNRR